MFLSGLAARRLSHRLGGKSVLVSGTIFATGVFAMITAAHSQRREILVALAVLGASLDDRLIDYEQGADLEGYVWAVKWQMLYPGITLLDESEHVRTWSDEVGITFHEVRVETNGHNVSLVFADLEVSRVEQGYAPFAVPFGGPEFKFPIA